MFTFFLKKILLIPSRSSDKLIYSERDKILVKYFGKEQKACSWLKFASIPDVSTLFLIVFFLIVLAAKN
jgi:hypothetical protein